MAFHVRYIVTNKVTLWAASYSACVEYTVTNKMKDDQDKTQRRLLSEIYIATDYEYLSSLNLLLSYTT